MAHQTFYIDIDEEITSIIERLKKTQASEVIIVVPKRALLIQSTVNLKILKKEADENEIQLMIVTQDKLGKVLIEKAGIFVQQKMDNISDEEISVNEKMIGGENYLSGDEIDKNNKNNNRLNKIGSESYFSENVIEEKIKQNLEGKSKKDVDEKSEPIKEKLINKELVIRFDDNSKKKKTQISLDISAKSKAKPNREILKQEDNFKIEDKNEKIENFFYQKNKFNNNSKGSYKNEIKDYNLSSKDHRWFLIFSLISFLVVVGVLTFLFLPKATLFITENIKTQSIDSSVVASTSINEIDFDKEIIPAKEVLAESSISESFNASGNKTVSNQKAHGKITIYNEYSSSSQPLVATTRFLSTDGKLFRLVDGITIPGMEIDGEETKPGTVEAQVIADEAGESFNIGADKFSIPGFQGSGNEKYSKFYAISEEAMVGGGSGNQTANYITDEDIASAKEKILIKLNEKIKSKLKEASGDKEVVILEDAMSKEEPIYKISNSSGDVVDSFEITIETKVKAIVVTKKDLDDIVIKMMAKAKNGVKNIDNNSVKLDFGKASTDFNAGTLEIRFHAVGEILPNLNLDEIKKEILGKNNDELAAYLSTFSDIKEANVKYWPFFINNQIPSMKSRVEIILDK